MMKTIYRTNALGQLKLQYNVFLRSRSIRLLIYTGLVIMFGIALAVAYSVSLSYIEGEPLKGESFLYEISIFGFSFAQIFSVPRSLRLSARNGRLDLFIQVLELRENR